MTEAVTERESPLQDTGAARRFRLVRLNDPSGVSGTGHVADGCKFADGWVAVHWPGNYASTSVWPDIESVLAIHGHDGATVVDWIDPDEPRGYEGPRSV